MSNNFNQLQVVKGTINSVLLKENKGKRTLWVEFKTAGGICAARFGVPMQTWDCYTMAEMSTALGKPCSGKQLANADINLLTVSLSKYAGKELAILVEPVELPGKNGYEPKTFWTVKRFWDAKYLSDNSNPVAESKNPFGVDDDAASEDTAAQKEIPF